MSSRHPAGNGTAPPGKDELDALDALDALDGLYLAHVAERQARAEEALAAAGYDRLVVHSGRVFTYFADDQDAPFHPTGHFAHWTPVEGPGHLLVVAPGKRPRLVRHTPPDFWYEPPAPPPPSVSAALDVVDVPTPEAAWSEVGRAPRTAFIGAALNNGSANANTEAEAAGIASADCNPAPLVSRLDWDRAYKTDYERACISSASRRAAAGFRAVETAFHAGASELEAHHAFLSAVGAMEEQLPYPTIIGFDEKSATLHYHGKRGRIPGRATVMLVDAGAPERGYGSDITRTFTTGTADPVFVSLRDAMETLQRRLAVSGRPGMPYLDLHLEAHRGVAAILSGHGILKVPAEETLDRGLTRPFLPHGLGHFLGIQVHDVGGRLAGPDGSVRMPPADHPYLRTTRTIEERMVFTIEPGLYFIPMLLAPFRTGRDSAAFDWPLVDRLTRSGGIRIEDDVYVGPDANVNLTRPYLPD